MSHGCARCVPTSRRTSSSPTSRASPSAARRSGGAGPRSRGAVAVALAVADGLRRDAAPSTATGASSRPPARADHRPRGGRARCSPTRTRRSTRTPPAWTVPATCSRSSSPGRPGGSDGACPPADQRTALRWIRRRRRHAGPGWSGVRPSYRSWTGSSWARCRPPAGPMPRPRPAPTWWTGPARRTASPGARGRGGVRDPARGPALPLRRALEARLLGPGRPAAPGHRARRDRAGGRRWARSSDGRRLSWSADGRGGTGHHLPPGAIVSATAAGRRLIEHTVRPRDLSMWPEIGEQRESVTLLIRPGAMGEHGVDRDGEHLRRRAVGTRRAARVSSPWQIPLKASG